MLRQVPYADLLPWRRSDQDSGLRATRTAAAPHATFRPCFLRGNERHATTTRRIHLVARLLQSMSGCNGCRRPPHACQHELTSPSVEDPDASPKKPTATHDRSVGPCSLTLTTPSLHVRVYLHEACNTGRRPIVASRDVFSNQQQANKEGVRSTRQASGQRPCLDCKFFHSLFIISNLWTHAWSIKCR